MHHARSRSSCLQQRNTSAAMMISIDLASVDIFAKLTPCSLIAGLLCKTQTLPRTKTFLRERQQACLQKTAQSHAATYESPQASATRPPSRHTCAHSHRPTLTPVLNAPRALLLATFEQLHSSRLRCLQILQLHDVRASSRKARRSSCAFDVKFGERKALHATGFDAHGTSHLRQSRFPRLYNIYIYIYIYMPHD